MKNILAMILVSSAVSTSVLGAETTGLNGIDSFNCEVEAITSNGDRSSEKFSRKGLFGSSVEEITSTYLMMIGAEPAGKGGQRSLRIIAPEKLDNKFENNQPSTMVFRTQPAKLTITAVRCEKINW